MAFEPPVSCKSETSMNLSTVRLVDPELNQLIEHATHVVVYSFKTSLEQWQKENIEGTLFVYSRKDDPKYKMIVINRINTVNFVETLNGDLAVQVQSPFLLYRSAVGKIIGIWFYNSAECMKISDSISNIIQEMKSPEPKWNLMTRQPNSASGEQGNKDGMPKRVLDFFAIASGKAPAGGRPPGVERQTDAEVKPPLLQRLLSNPSQPVHTLEQIESLHRSTPPKTKEPPIISQPSHSTPINTRPLSLVSEPPYVSQVENGLGFMRINDSSSPLPLMDGSPPDEPAPVALIPPDLFAQSALNSTHPHLHPSASAPSLPMHVSGSSYSLHTNPSLHSTQSSTAAFPLHTSSSRTIVFQSQESAITLDPTPEPLTKAQLLQAVTYLLKNDADFVNKLHEAYVKSFVDRVS